MIWPLVAYFAFVVVLVGAILVISSLLGPRHLEPATGEPYEGGIVLLSLLVGYTKPRRSVIAP